MVEPLGSGHMREFRAICDFVAERTGQPRVLDPESLADVKTPAGEALRLFKSVLQVTGPIKVDATMGDVVGGWSSALLTVRGGTHLIRIGGSGINAEWAMIKAIYDALADVEVQKLL